VLMAVEHAPPHRRGFFGSWPQVGAPLGLVLGTLVFSTVSGAMNEADFMAWGWRIPFYIYATFTLAYATQALGMNRQDILNAVLVAASIEVFTIPAFGALSDKLGRRPVYIFGAVFSALMSVPLFMLLATKSPHAAMLAIVLGLAIGHAAMYGPQASFLSELFGARVRYSGVSLGYNLASVFAGALSPLIATWLMTRYSPATWPISAYMIGLALITVVSVYFASETRSRSPAGGS